MVLQDLTGWTANLDLHAGDRPAAIDDGAVAARVPAIGGHTRQQILLDQLEPNTFARRH